MARTGEHAPQSFTGFDRLADRAVAWLAERRRAAREREAARRAENPPPLFPRKRWDAMPPERRAELWAVRDMAMDAALGSPSIMTYGAAAARLGNAGRFAAMSRRGAGDAVIRRATRYERGPFGYGVETRGDATLRPAAVFGAAREGSLGDLAYIHPEVARAYPTMRDVKVEMVPSAEWADRLAAARAASAEAGGAGSTGAYAKATDTILVKGPSETEPLHMFADRADRTLVHEMQHAAQARDGILGSTAGDYRTAAKEVDARNSANRRWLGPAERREMPRMNTQDVRPEEVHMDDKGGKSGGFKGWKAYKDAKEAAEAEAAAVAVVNAGITNAPPLSAADLADSRASAEWLKSHERKGLVAEGTLPHTGRPRFYSGNGFMEGDTSFQGDRFSSVVPVDLDAYHRDAEAYKKTGRWAVIPTIYPDADGVTRLHTGDAAESEYRKSGSHFGIFEGMENAESGAQWDHHRGNAAWAERETKQAAKGGDNFGNFTNFLATDDVPEFIFGIPVVQDESQYTEKDLAFFRENPKAAGFYEMGDEEDVESQEAWGGADTLDDIREMTARWARESDGRPRLVPGRSAVGPVAELRPRGGYVVPTGIASALGAQVDPAGEAKRGYLATARGEASDPLVEELGLPSGAAYAPLVALGAIQAAEAFGGKGKPGKAAKPGQQGLSVEAPRVDWATMEAARQRYRNDPAMARAPDYLKYTLFVNELLEGKNAAAKTPRDVPLMNGIRIPILNDPELVSRTLSTISDDAVRGADAFWRAGVRKLSVPRMMDERMGTPLRDEFGNLLLDPAVRQAFDRGYYIPGSLYSYNVPGRISNHFPFARPVVPVAGESATYYVDGAHDVGPVAGQPPGYIGARGSFELDVPPGAGQGVQMWWHGDSGRITLPNMYFGGRMLGSDPREFGGDPGLGPVDVTYPPSGTRRADGAGKTAKDVHGLVQKFKDHVRTYENRRVKPYRDVDGNWAVGYGSHYLADGTKVTPNTAVTDRMIDDAFDADLARRVDLLAGYDRRQARFAVPNWRYMSPESRLMLLDVSWGRKDTLTEKKSPGLFGELRAAGKDKAALDDAVRRHYLSYRKATDANGAVDESKTAGLQNRRIALLKALTGEDFSYDGKKWSTEKNKFVEE